MKKAILSILLVLSSCILYGGGIRDKSQVLSPEERRLLESLCEDIQLKYDLNIYIYLLDRDQKRPYVPSIFGRSSYLYAFIDLQKAEVSLKMTEIPDDLKIFHRQVFSQWVETYLKEQRPLSDGLSMALKEINKQYQLRKLLSEQDAASIAPPDEFTSRTRSLLNFFEALFVAFVLLFTLKGFRSGNQYEIVEYYGLSRLTGKIKISIGICSLPSLPIYFFWSHRLKNSPYCM